MPQLSQIGEIYASQLFWLAIVFALIYFAVGRAMVPKIERTIDDRAARVSGDLAAAAAARAQADSAEQAYQSGLESARSEAARAVAEAQARAAASNEARLKAGDAETHDRVAAAARRIETAKAGALGEIEGATVDAVQAIVAKLSGVEIDRTAAEARVRSELAHG